MNRNQAEKNYQVALKAVRTAENSLEAGKITNDEYFAACGKLDAARSALVAAEIAAPTYKETKRINNELRFRNRGMDF